MADACALRKGFNRWLFLDLVDSALMLIKSYYLMLLQRRVVPRVTHAFALFTDVCF